MFIPPIILGAIQLPPLILGTLGMLVLGIGIAVFMVFHQRKIIRYNNRFKRLEEEKQQILLDASIRFQEEERNRIAADLHDDVGPLLATARLYLTDNMVDQQKQQQLQSISNTKQIIDDAILLVRNLSHSLMPPTLKNFGLESAAVDIFQKLAATGNYDASAHFKNYSVRLTTEQELLVFRITQELITNIIKYSHATFIHLVQQVNNNYMYFRIRHDGKGLLQEDFEMLNQKASGLGLKNIASRIRVLNGTIFFEFDAAHACYKVTMKIPMQAK